MGRDSELLMANTIVSNALTWASPLHRPLVVMTGALRFRGAK
ncbi:hypothetical protein [Natrialba chahannaoensis]|nr:hypothetical protein [Natrialba chahannaoensis]